MIAVELTESVVANLSQTLCCRDKRIWSNCEIFFIKKAFSKDIHILELADGLLYFAGPAWRSTSTVRGR
jgi:hypothetical protein